MNALAYYVLNLHFIIVNLVVNRVLKYLNSNPLIPYHWFVPIFQTSCLTIFIGSDGFAKE